MAREKKRIGKKEGLVLALWVMTYLPFSLWAAPRGIPGDGWADRVLGQIDFKQVNFNETTAKGLSNAYSTVVDRPHNRLYVYDSGNNRVLGVSNLGSLTSGQGADIVLGQPDMNHSACNGDSAWENYPAPVVPNASCLCGLHFSSGTPAEAGSSGNMAVDPWGNLYVPDYYNNRVLRYDWPIVSGQAASGVWGQSGFSGYQANFNGALTPNNSSIAFIHSNNVGGGIPYNLYLGAVGTDDWGNLWVADPENRRVLRFPNPNAPGPGVPATVADVVLGQPNFTSTTGASGPTDASRMGKPTGVRVDAAGNVYVTDLPPIGVPGSDPNYGYGCAGRILVYQPTGSSGGVPTYTNGQAPLTQFGQQYFVRPVGLELDPTVPSGVGLWVTDTHQILQYVVSMVPSHSVTLTKVLMKAQPQLRVNSSCGAGGVVGNGPNFTDLYGQVTSSWSSCDLQGMAGVDASGNLYLGGKLFQDVWRFPAPIPTPQPGIAHSADRQIFKSAQSGLFNERGMRGMYYSIGLAVGETQAVTQIIAADRSRLMFWNLPASGPSGLSDGMAADGVAGSSRVGDPFWQGHPELWRIKADQASSQPHLWAIRGNNAVIQVFNLPLSNGQSAAMTIAPPLNVLGGGTVSWSTVEGITPTSDGNFLWIADRQNNRVLRVRNPLSPGRVVDIILGQTSASGTLCNLTGAMVGWCDPCTSPPTGTSLHFPGALSMDHQGNLYVSDNGLECRGNIRLLRWNVSQLPPSPASCLFGLPASAVYGRNGSFTSTACADPVNGVCAPWEVAFSPDDSVAVVGENFYGGSRFPIVLSNPLTGDTPATRLNDFYTHAYASSFDSQGNLYMADLNRSRVMVYYQPFPSPFPTATPTFTFTPTPTPPASWRINCGGPARTDTAGNTWLADTQFSGGNISSNGSPIAGTLDAPLYQDERWGNSTYTLPVVPGTYKVTLKFCELFVTGPNQRMFHVYINGVRVITDLDIYAQTGGRFIAYDRVFTGIVPDGLGRIVIQFTAGTLQNPQVGAIEVVQEALPPTATMSPTRTASMTSTATLSPTPSGTSTPTETLTVTPTESPTLTSTDTIVPTFTSTPTLTPSETWTATFADTATSSPTGTGTSTSTDTPTPSPSPSFTETPTPVPPTATNTPSPIPPTGTSTPTRTSTGTRTNTPSSPSPTPTRTRTSTMTKTATMTSTPTRTPTATPVVVTVQAEAACSFGGAVMTNHAGYTGTGFVDLINNNTAGITFAFQSATAQTVSLTFRYANGSGAARSMRLLRYSPSTSSAVTISFPATASWSGWATATGSVPLVAGNNLIRLVPTSTNNNGGPNLDQVSFSLPGVSVGTCGGAQATQNFTVAAMTPGIATLTQTPTPMGPTVTPTEPSKGTVLFPNPARDGRVTLRGLPLSGQTDTRVRLYTVMGRKVSEREYRLNPGDGLELSLEDGVGETLSNGLYLMVVDWAGGKWTGKLVVMR